MRTILTFLLLTPLLSVQDKPGWDKPTEVVGFESMLIPWHIYEGKHGALLVALQMKERDDFQLVQYEEMGGRWKKDWGTDLGKLKGPPGTFVTGNRMLLLFPGEDKKPGGLIVNLANGTGKAITVKNDDFKEMDDDVWPTVTRHKGKLYCVAAAEGKSPREVHLMVSGDDGMTWTRTGEKNWVFYRGDGCRPLLFALGGRLHLVLRDKAEEAGLSHYSSEDGSSFREEKTEFPNTGKATLPFAVSSDGESACIFYATFEKSRSQSVVRTLLNNKGAGWSAGGDMMKTGINDPSNFNTVGRSGDSIWFAGIYIDPEGEGMPVATVRRSTDAGKTWKDMNVGQGVARVNVFTTGGWVGSDYYAVFFNLESMQKLGAGGGYVLARRWGAGRAEPSKLSEEDRRKVRDLAEKLESDDLEERDKAETALAKMGDRIIPEIAKIISEVADADVRERLKSIRKKLHPVWWKGR